MSRDIFITLLLFVGGTFFALHCGAATRREFRAGLAKGMFGDYRRGSQPNRFWSVILMNALASLLGVFFIGAGLARSIG